MYWPRSSILTLRMIRVHVLKSLCVTDNRSLLVMTCSWMANIALASAFIHATCSRRRRANATRHDRSRNDIDDGGGGDGASARARTRLASIKKNTNAANAKIDEEKSGLPGMFDVNAWKGRIWQRGANRNAPAGNETSYVGFWFWLTKHWAAAHYDDRNYLIRIIVWSACRIECKCRCVSQIQNDQVRTYDSGYLNNESIDETWPT